MMVSARLTPEAKAALIRQHLDDGVPLTRLAAAAGLPARTLRRWAASYRIDPTACALQRQEGTERPADSNLRPCLRLDPGRRWAARRDPAGQAARCCVGRAPPARPGLPTRPGRRPPQ